MKFTLSWLKDHLDTAASLDALTTRLTALGLEVEDVVDRSKVLAAFTVAHVQSAEKHPDADKLRVCMVDTGKEVLQIVCGAPNARAGLKVAFAPVGATVPATGTVLKKGVIRGVESNGMLCSARELGVSEESEGIMELPADAPVGAPFAEVLGLNDPLIDINLTPDRADCAGVRGIARDMAAAGLGTLKPLKDGAVRGSFKSPVGVKINLPADASNACPMFAGRLIRNVKNGPSPKWLQDKLLAVGLRPISALVDITNYLSLDQARPLHVFDADTLKGDLVVRLSHKGEELVGLNGKTYTLDDGMTIIADSSGVLSLGGIMGGESTGCTEKTVNVFVECALFDPIRTAMTGRTLDILSDARYRFERGVDPASVLPGMDQATRLILELCGGEPSEVVVAGAEPDWRRTYHLRADRCETLGGVQVPAVQQADILSALGFTVIEEADGGMRVAPPSWRGDVHGEADLVEEVLRVIGFDAIPAIPMERTVSVTQPAISVNQRRPLQVRRTLAARGMEEAVTWSFMAHDTASLFGQINPDARLVNPISTDLDTLRPSILGNLIAAAGRNAARGYPDAALFEIGPAFRSGEPGDQSLVAAGVRTQTAGPRHWLQRQRPIDAFDAKADAIAVLEAAGAPTTNLQIVTGAPDYYHPGRSGVMRLGPSVLAYFGEIHPAVLDAMKVDGPIVAFEVVLDAIPQPKKKGGTARPLVELSPFQPVNRDFAFVVDRNVEADKLVRAAKGADKALIREVGVFDVYEGAGVPEGKKSLAITVTLQPVERTLTDADIESVGQKVVASVVKATGGALRS